MFAFSQITPRQTGLVDRNLEVPYGTYLGASIDQGFHDSAFASVMRMTENNIYDDGTKISADEANKKYGLPTLKFDEPVNEVVASMMNKRKRAELDRAFYFEHADTSHGGWIPGFAATMLGQISNPLDLGLMFMPIVGEEKLAAQAGGPVRKILSRGLVTEEALAERGLPAKLTSSMIQGSVGSAVSEVPLFISNMQDHANYSIKDSITNVIGGGLFGGALHLGVSYFIKPLLAKAGIIMSTLSPETKEVMAKQAMNDFLNGEDISVHDYVNLDENYLREKAKFDENAAKLQGIQHADSLLLDNKVQTDAQYAQIVQDFIDKKRAEYDPQRAYSETRAAEIARQQAEGKILRDDQIQASTYEDAQKASGQLDLDLSNIQQESAAMIKMAENDLKDLKEKLKVNPEDSALKSQHDLLANNLENFKKEADGIVKSMAENDAKIKKALDVGIDCLGKNV